MDFLRRPTPYSRLPLQWEWRVKEVSGHLFDSARRHFSKEKTKMLALLSQRSTIFITLSVVVWSVILHTSHNGHISFIIFMDFSGIRLFSQRNLRELGVADIIACALCARFIRVVRSFVSPPTLPSSTSCSALRLSLTAQLFCHCDFCQCYTLVGGSNNLYTILVEDDRKRSILLLYVSLFCAFMFVTTRMPRIAANEMVLFLVLFVAIGPFYHVEPIWTAEITAEILWNTSQATFWSQHRHLPHSKRPERDYSSHSDNLVWSKRCMHV